MAFIVLFSIASAGLVAGSSLPAFIRIAGAVSFAAIREVTELDRKTISKYIQQEDFSKGPEQYAKGTRPSKLDPYKPIIGDLLEKQSEYFHKQRFTAKRMHEYLVEECGAKELEHSYILVRKYMKRWKNERRRNNGPGTLKLVWHPGEAQADFGQADFIDTDGSYVRKHYLVMSFPFSNTALYEILPGENGECVCQGLQDFFTYLGGVPYSILFDNATGIAKRYANIIQQSELFTRFRLHHNFVVRFANIRSGWEKGNVENKVGALRRNLLVPPMQLSYPLQQFNKDVMIPRSFAFRADEQHYEKGASFRELFVQDRKALGPLPAKAFHVAKIESLGTNGTGSLTLESGHTYVLGSGRTNESVLVSKGAWDISVYTTDGVFIKTFPRAYGKEPSTVYDIEAKGVFEFLYVLYNFWYREVEDAILAKPAVTDYLGKVATELSRQFSNVLTLNFDCLLDNKHMPSLLKVQHLHGRFIEGLQNYGEVQFFSSNDGKSFQYTYLYGSNAIEKGDRLKKIHDYFQSSPPKYYDLDFLFGDGKDWGNLLVYGVSFLPTAVFPEGFFRCFPEDKGVPGEPDYYFVNSLDGHILFQIQKLLELGMIKHVTIACYSEDNRKLYEELLSQTPIAKNLTLCPCKDVPFSPGLKRLIGT